ncbi:MAG: hypothetical protein AAF235_06670, partial [Planctomycetota bacterium]
MIPCAVVGAAGYTGRELIRLLASHPGFELCALFGSGRGGDAVRIAGMQDMLVEGNHLHSMLGTPHAINHADMIQFWGTNAKQNTERVTIRENVISTGDGPTYQMIFGGNDEKRKNGWLFEDIVIERN